jgi:GNAT superfamily N-acetyltransferase
MSVMIPELEEGRVYHAEEVAKYIGTQSGTSDFVVAGLHFPKNLKTWEHDCTAWRDREEILLQYKVFAIEEFKLQFWERAECMKRSGEWERVERIVEILEKGDPLFPVLMQKNDPQHRIIEGHHRSIALLWLGSNCLPAFLLGYKNWFMEDELMPGFEREDEIVQGTIKEVLAFFRLATCIDQMGIMIGLFDPSRLHLDDEVLFAKHRGKIIGVIVASPNLATLETVYVLKQYRSKGVAYRLCEQALVRLKDLGIAEITCDVQSKGMAATLERLALERPDLRAIIRLASSSQPDEEIEIDCDDLLDMQGKGW